MAKTLIKIAVALIVIHGAFRVGSAYWNFYRYEDALLQIAQFGDRSTERQVCDEALTIAADFGVAIAAADLTVHKGGNPPFNCETGPTALKGSALGIATVQLTIEGWYQERLQLLPGYFYPWEFKPTASARVRF
jgi:hypothetical protein